MRDMITKNLKWVQDRVQGQHHQALSKYLCDRTERQREEANAAGLPASVILQRGFDAERGQIAVPLCAIKALGYSPDVSPEDVLHIVKEVGNLTEGQFKARVKKYRRAVHLWADRTRLDPSPFLAWLDVVEVMRS